MDSVYPEPMSILYKRAVRKKVHKGCGTRYRTQPVTFSEIQEVDEDNVEDNERSAAAASKSELDLKAKFEEFKRQRDRDLRESTRLDGGGDSVISDADPSEPNGNRSSFEDLIRGRPIPKPVTSLRGTTSHPRPSI